MGTVSARILKLEIKHQISNTSRTWFSDESDLIVCCIARTDPDFLNHPFITLLKIGFECWHFMILKKMFFSVPSTIIFLLLELVFPIKISQKK